MSEWKVVDDGLPANGKNISITVGGKEINSRIAEYTVTHHASGLSELQLRVNVVELETYGDTQPQFYGLELVPTAALLQELERREKDAETVHE